MRSLPFLYGNVSTNTSDTQLYMEGNLIYDSQKLSSDLVLDEFGPLGKL